MDKKGFLKGAAIGALIASVATLFLAPKSGKKVRADVVKLVDGLTKRIVKEVENASDMSQEAYEKLVKKSVTEYAKNKKLASGYIAEVSDMLMDRWDDVRKTLNKK